MVDAYKTMFARTGCSECEALHVIGSRNWPICYILCDYVIVLYEDGKAGGSVQFYSTHC